MSDTNLWDHHQNENRVSLEEWYFRQDFIKREIWKRIVPGGKILEIGFGDGYLLAELSKWWYSVIWQDLSEENISLTKNQWKDANIDFLLGDESGKLLVEDNSLDWFIASEVCEHMTDDELVIFVGELKRVMREWSQAIITVPYHENLARMTQFCPHCSNSFHTWWHKQSWNDEKIEKVFSGFSDLKIRRFMSLGRTHSENFFIRTVAKWLDLLFWIKQNSFEFLPSNYLIILKK